MVGLIAMLAGVCGAFTLGMWAGIQLPRHPPAEPPQWQVLPPACSSVNFRRIVVKITRDGQHEVLIGEVDVNSLDFEANLNAAVIKAQDRCTTLNAALD